MTVLANPLVRLPARRLFGSPRAWWTIGAWSLSAAGVAIEVARARAGAATALVDVFGALIVPFVAYCVAGAVLGDEGLTRSLRPLVGLGAEPARAAAGASLVVCVTCATLLAALGALVATLVHVSGDPPVLRDALTTAWVAALGGVAYGALFVFAASFGRYGRGVVLALDFALGTIAPLDVVTPRGHLRSLLGGESVLDLDDPWSAASLAALALAFTALASRRSRRPAS